jgi:hypothetical protein
MKNQNVCLSAPPSSFARSDDNGMKSRTSPRPTTPATSLAPRSSTSSMRAFFRSFVGVIVDEAHHVRNSASWSHRGGPGESDARADGWNPEGPVAYRVAEVVDFHPVAHEWVERAS